jgi:predicted alpha/beta hydrolase family esterase
MTLATFLRIGLVTQLAGGTALGAWLLPGELRWFAPAIGVAVPLVVTAIALAIEFAVGVIVDPRSPPVPVRYLLPIWWAETRISLRMFTVEQPFAARFPEPALTHDPQRPAVLLVHGYLCNRAVWRSLLASGTLAGCNVATVNLEPIFGPIDRYADVVALAVARLRAATGAAQVVLVGHSMGGLAIRAYLRAHGDAAVAKVITLAAPHHGTVFGPIGAGANARQMGPGSPFMQGLAQALPPPLARKFVCLATRDDNLIVPRSSPLLPGARHVVLEGVGHLDLIKDPRAWQVLREETSAPAARTAA